MEKRKVLAINTDEKQFSEDQARAFIESIIKDSEVKQNVQKQVKKEANTKDKKTDCEIM